MEKGNGQFDSSDLASIEVIIRQKEKRSFIHHCSGISYFIKRNRPTKLPIAPFLIKGFLGFFGFGFLAPSLKYGGKYSFQYELDTLRRFRDFGVLVPRLFYEAEDFIVLEALDGENVDILMGDERNSIEVWKAAASGIAALHRQGLCLSQGFARNIMLVKGSVVFIDFEENPLLSMDMDQAQARDWIYFLLSTLWQFDSYGQVISYWRLWVESESLQVRQILSQIAEKMDWLRYLPSQRKPWGRDVIQLQAIGRFFKEWKRG